MVFKRYTPKNEFPTGKLGIWFWEKRLFPETEFFDQSAIAFQVMLAEVVEQALALADKLHESTMGGKILLICLKVLGNVVNAFRNQGNLAFNGTSVFGISAEFGENPRLFFSSNS